MYENQKYVIRYLPWNKISTAVNGILIHLLQISHKQACAFDNAVGSICGRRLENR